MDTIRRAAKVHPICDLQIEYSLVSRNVEVNIIPALRMLGIGMTAYGVLSRGLLTGTKPSGKSDIRAQLPRFSGGNAERNQPLVDALARIATKRGVSSVQLAVRVGPREGRGFERDDHPDRGCSHAQSAPRHVV